MNKYLLKEKKIGAIILLQERSAVEEIYQFPEDYLIIARGYVVKLTELGFLLQGNTYFMVHFTREVPHNEIVFENERKWDLDGKGKQEVNVGVDPSKFNNLSEDEKRTFIIKLIAQVLREYINKYYRDTELVDKVEALILKHGGDLEVVYKVKETKKYKLIFSHQIKGHDKSNAIIEYTDMINATNNSKIEIPLRDYFDIDELISKIKVEVGRVKILSLSDQSVYRSKGLLQDPKASPSVPGQPFFIRKEGDQVYTGFPLIPETEIDGFTYGAITNFLVPDSEEGCTSGDAFVQAPDGSRAGLDWVVDEKLDIQTMIEPDKRRWGVYAINFPKPVKTLEDLIYNFQTVLPLIKEKYSTK